MGEVYRAHDTRLGRDVAIKVLPDAVASDPDRRARFERETKAVAALSHPNILAIFDTGIHEGQLFAVTELLQGQTLRDRLATAFRPSEESESSSAGARARGGGTPRAVPNGALSPRKAIEISVPIARGLAAAHAKGLIHRDLKPENVFLIEDGQVKILDFGLVRQVGPETASGATKTFAGTNAGVVMGTIGYMAPEQVLGQTVDARADIFALGAVLYEMLSGRRAFQGATAADSMTAILSHDPPDLAGVATDLPPALDRIVRHCLEKNPSERFQSARDVAFALESLSGSGVSSGPAPVSIPMRSRRPASAWIAGSAIGIGLACRRLVRWTCRCAVHGVDDRNVGLARGPTRPLRDVPRAGHFARWHPGRVLGARRAGPRHVVEPAVRRSGCAPAARHRDQRRPIPGVLGTRRKGARLLRGRQTEAHRARRRSATTACGRHSSARRIVDS